MAADVMPIGGGEAAVSASFAAESGWKWPRSRRARRAIYALLVLQVAVIIGFAAAYGPFDLNIYLWGGKAVTQGMRLYAVESHANWFTYPPFAAVIFIPLAALPNFVVRMAWELATVAALVWSCVLCMKLAGQRPSRIVLLAMVAAGLLLEPVYHTLYLGQVNLFLLALVLHDVWRSSQGRPAGIGIGIATAIKLVPGIFILLFLLTRRTRDALTAAVTLVGCGLLGYIVDPPASRLYWTRLFYNVKRVSAPYISNQSPYSALARILNGDSHVGSWYLLVPLVLGVVGLAVSTTLARRQDWLGAATMTGVTGLMVSPISWTHHWVWIIPGLVVMLRGGRASKIAAAGAYVLFVVAPMWFTPHSGEAGDYGFHWVQTLLANSFLLAGLAFMAYLTIITYRPAKSRGGEGPPEPVAASTASDAAPLDSELALGT